jgi:hypothetical protein
MADAQDRKPGEEEEEEEELDDKMPYCLLLMSALPCWIAHQRRTTRRQIAIRQQQLHSSAHIN